MSLLMLSLVTMPSTFLFGSTTGSAEISCFSSFLDAVSSVDRFDG